MTADDPLDPSPRELVNDWLRALTVLGERDKTPQQRLDLIAEVNQVRTHPVTLGGSLSEHDQRVLAEAQRKLTGLHSRRVGVNIAVEELLMAWLGQATGQTRAQIIQRLALELDETLPPENA